MKYSELESGKIISSQQFNLDKQFVDNYVRATSDTSSVTYNSYAPPMLLAALAVRAAITELKIPGGTLHIAQEVEFYGPFRIGKTILCSATLLQNSLRGGMRILVIGLSIEDNEGANLMSGKSTITVPS